VDSTAQQLIEWRLTKLNTAFALHLDRREYESMIALFTPDATYERHGNVHNGHAEIREAMHERPDFTVRHLVSNLHFTEITDDHARGDLVLMAYSGPARTDGNPVHYSYPQGHLMEIRDYYVHTGDGWRISERVVAPLLVPVDIR
jgi:hypothetical protein